MDVIKCRECGQETEADSIFCSYCGGKINFEETDTEINVEKQEEVIEEKQESHNTYCRECGKQIVINMGRCPRCGCSTKEVVENLEMIRCEEENKEDEKEEDPIDKTINGITNYRDTLNFIFTVIAVICGLSVFFAIAAGGVEASLLILVSLIPILITKFIIKIFLSWMIYMLQTNYDILKEIRKIDSNK